jgi:bifunctional non-homologous end joining protein LigD
MNILGEYKRKRSFKKTPEPGAVKKSSESGRIFVVQKHRASHLHYDFRLEADGVLKSWAVPKGPSLNPADKRLAMAVEDHPLDYAAFEGVIPEGEYGGGTVMVWDKGTYSPDEGNEDVSKALARGELKFTLKGKRLKGSWALVRTSDRKWLLIKHRDRYASETEIAETKPRSVVTGRTLAEIARDEGGNVEKAATGDPDDLTRRSGGKAGTKSPVRGSSSERSVPPAKDSSKKRSRKAIGKKPSKKSSSKKTSALKSASKSSKKSTRGGGD